MSRWHPREHTKALRAMQSLTLEERGAYNTCLDLIYEREGPIPDDNRWLAGWMGVSVRKWVTIRACLIVKGKLYEISLNGVPSLMNERAVIELENQSERSRNAAEIGAKGGRKSAETRANTNENNGERQANAPLTLKLVTITETDIEPDDTKARESVDWSARLDEARSAACDALDPISTGVMHARDLRALVEPASGEPCDWLEVLDAVRMCAARAKTRGKLIRSWSWVREDALALRDKRLNAANPEPRKAHVQHHPDQSKSPRSDRLGRSLAGLMAAVDEREPPVGRSDP